VHAWCALLSMGRQLVRDITWPDSCRTRLGTGQIAGRLLTDGSSMGEYIIGDPEVCHWCVTRDIMSGCSVLVMHRIYCGTAVETAVRMYRLAMHA